MRAGADSSIIGRTTQAQTASMIPHSMQQSRAQAGKRIAEKGGMSTAHLTQTQNRKAFRGFKHLTNADTSTAMTPGARQTTTGGG